MCAAAQLLSCLMLRVTGGAYRRFLNKPGRGRNAHKEERGVVQRQDILVIMVIIIMIIMMTKLLEIEENWGDYGDRGDWGN